MARDEEEYEDEQEDEDFEAGSDEEDVEEELEEEDTSSKKGKGKAKSSSNKRKKSSFFEEEADEDDDDEDEGAGGRKRPKASRFIDDIAAVDSDEEEEDADEDMDDMLAHNDEDLGGEEFGAGAAAHYRDLDMRRQGGRQEETEEEMLKRIEEKYKEADYDDEEDDYGHYGEEEDVGQQGLQPTKEDPGLFIVTCRIGSEREACLQLLQKCYNMAERGTPLAIKSAVCLDHLKGFFYVEAFRDSHVMEAIRGLRTIYPGKGARLVPLKERPAAVTVNRQAKAAIERDSWVRVRGGLYKDDLAKVVDVDFAGGRATIKLVPRLDLAAMAKDHMGGGARRNPFGRQAVRPPPKPFRAKEAGELGLPVGKDRNDPAVITLNTHRFLDGYTLRNYTLKGLILQDVAPPLDEISRFNQAGQTGDLDDLADPTAGLKQLLKALPDGAAPKATYVKGDRVMVIAGDLNTLEGTVEDVKLDDGKLLVRPDLMLDQVVELELDEVQKLFKAGDHVRVLSGPHAGSRGMVVSVLNEEGVCILLPDSKQGELRVFIKDLTEAVDSNTGVEMLGNKYELHDLVQLDANTAGVIIGIEKDYARVLTSQSTVVKPDVRMCKESDIMRKLQTNRASTQDSTGVVVNSGDYVELIDTTQRPGQTAAKQAKGGIVHAINRGVLFLKDPSFADRGGFIVVRNRQVRSKSGKAAAAQAAAAANGAQGAAGAGPGNVLASPQHNPGAGPQNPFEAGGAPGGFGGRGGFAGGRGGRGGRHGASGLQGQEVTVRSGPYARYKGRVKQETATHVQLELHAINRIVTVKKDHVFGTGPGMPPMPGRGGYTPGARPMGGGYGGYGGYTPSGPPRTPAHVMQTPMHPSMGGATPLHPSMGGATPLHPSMGGATPLHPSMTPMHPSMTPMHPGMTPAHPSMDADYDQPSSRGGSRAAAGPGSSRGPPPPAAATPGGYGGYGAAVSTPGGLGGYAPAPTPGTAETPGAAGFADPGNARTPGAMAATPGDAYGAAAYTPGYAPAQTPGGQDMPAPSPATGAYGSDAYYGQPTPGMGATPGTVQTPGMVTGYTPGITPSMAFTPGLDGAGAGGVPSTPGLAGVGVVGQLPEMPGTMRPPAPVQRGPDYRDVLVKLPDGGVGVGGEMQPGTNQLVAYPVGGGDAVLLEVVELVEVDKKDKVKVVFGDKAGLVGEIVVFDGGDAVLNGGVVIDRTMLGKLKDQ